MNSFTKIIFREYAVLILLYLIILMVFALVINLRNSQRISNDPDNTRIKFNICNLEYQLLRDSSCTVFCTAISPSTINLTYDQQLLLLKAIEIMVSDKKQGTNTWDGFTDTHIHFKNLRNISNYSTGELTISMQYQGNNIYINNHRYYINDDEMKHDIIKVLNMLLKDEARGLP